MILSHKIELKLNATQIQYCKKACGIARFAYNYALDLWKKEYEAKKLDPSLPSPNEMSLRVKLNAVKKKLFPWMAEVTKCAPQLAIMNLGEAFQRFFKGLCSYPRFKKKGQKESFGLSNDQFEVKGKKFWIPKLGWVRMRESLRFEGKILKATVSQKANKWFVSITVDALVNPYLKPAENQGVIGVDLGVSTLAALSNGEKLANPKHLKKSMDKLKFLQRQLSRKTKGSKNREKAKVRLAKYHLKVSNQRSDALHKATSYIASIASTVVIENLNVKGMLKNHNLANSISDASFGEFRRQLEYKTTWRGGQIIVADRWFASSKLCSSCGYKNTSLVLGIESWVCPECGSIHDRDFNAATNLAKYAESYSVSACGGESSGSGRKTRVKLSPVKQEKLTTVLPLVGLCS